MSDADQTNHQKDRGRGRRGSDRYSHGGRSVVKKESAEAVDDSPVIQMFRMLAAELDSKHDKAERIVKHSRDITIESKRIIFLLHTINDETKKDTVLKEAGKRLAKLRQTNFRCIAQELHGEDAHQFLRSYTFGLQEYIEALTFYHYLKSGNLIGWEDVQNELEYSQRAKSESSDTAGQEKEETNGQEGAKESTRNTVLVTPVDYVLGVADLTGELMRKCITNVGLGMIESCYQTCAFVRQIHSALVGLNGGGVRELSRKMSVLHASLGKMETACYTIHVRGSEIPKHMIADMISGEEMSLVDESFY